MLHEVLNSVNPVNLLHPANQYSPSTEEVEECLVLSVMDHQMGQGGNLSMDIVLNPPDADHLRGTSISLKISPCMENKSVQIFLLYYPTATSIILLNHDPDLVRMGWKIHTIRDPVQMASRIIHDQEVLLPLE
jgi:hypothetical protein